MTSHGAPHFFALPDRDEAGAVARRLQDASPGLRTIDHPSGRPWLIGLWADEDIAVARAGNDAVALIGTLPRLGDELSRWAGKLDGRVDRLVGLSMSLPGSYHVMGSIGGTLYAQGTAYGVRRIHHARLDGCLVVGDRAVALADLTGAEVDITAVALRLPEPLGAQLPERPMWHGITAVAPGSYLTAPATGAPPRHVRWHRPPAPTRPMAAGAAAVRTALVAAVEARTHRGGLISADLSGGLDSTSLCSLAADRLGEGEMIACSIPGDESIWDDAVYARRAAAAWPHVEHVELAYEDTPLFYSGLIDDGCRTDVPGGVAMSRARSTVLMSLMAERGSRLHMTGHGGDHLFFHTGPHYHHLLTRRPLLALERLRGYRTLYGWRWSDLVRQLADRRSYNSALSRISMDGSGTLEFTSPGLTWIRQPVVQPWLTPECRDLVTRELRLAARNARPYAPTMGRHLELSALYTGTQDCAAIAEAGLRVGVPVTMPYLDDAVIDAALAVRVEDRATPWEYKPVLKEAMRGILPEECRVRTTKVEGTVDAVGGLYRHRDEVGALWQDSVLAKAGLIDAAALARLCETPGTPALKDGAVDSTIICETWLRAVS
ncbi:asparagine synthase-related protein [Streptomyces cinnamoneus]|uniref:asparagine synthase-related protein n=1 Tax=Streptomyces cinnamoneus TaxID=53446 RepID=UPI0033EFEA91